MMNQNTGNADEPEKDSTDWSSLIKLPTLGGMQFWTDLRWWHGWRIQQNKITDQCRILDASNVRHSWGDRTHCEEKFKAIVGEQTWPEPPEHVVVCLHGLMRTQRSYHALGSRIEEETDATTIYFGYSSTRASVAEHAKAFRGLVEGLPGNPKIDLVGHSMGNIVARHAIADWKRDGDSAGVLTRLNRFVMQGPPNQGAQIAKRLKTLNLFEAVTGRSGLELGADWDSIQDKLATPECEFGIIAGCVKTGPIKNPLVEGDSDLVVSVEEAKLSGASDFVVVPCAHSFLMDSKSVNALTVRYLTTGAFAEDGQRNPLP